jgi:hypothetical protein
MFCSSHHRCVIVGVIDFGAVLWIENAWIRIRMFMHLILLSWIRIIGDPYWLC